MPGQHAFLEPSWNLPGAFLGPSWGPHINKKYIKSHSAVINHKTMIKTPLHTQYPT